MHHARSTRHTTPRARSRPASAPAAARLRHDRGEGVISAAIAVLVMAALGALMWVGFKALWEDTARATREKVVDEIGA